MCTTALIVYTGEASAPHIPGTGTKHEVPGTGTLIRACGSLEPISLRAEAKTLGLPDVAGREYVLLWREDHALCTAVSPRYHVCNEWYYHPGGKK